MTAASLIEDSPVDLKTQAGLYIPQDYDHRFKGLVSLRTALGSSLNVPAVRTIVLVTPNAFQERLKSLGFSLKQSGDYYGFSLALGSAEVNLLALTNAYRTLANRGRSSSPRLLLDAKDGATTSQVLEAGPSFIVADILADRSARSSTFGLGNILETRYWSAVKTGTSKDMRDNWCIGFSEHYTVGVWIGNDNGKPMWDVSGVTGAAPIWHSVMDYLHTRDQFQSTERSIAPLGVVQSDVTFKRQIEPERMEFFLAGTETREVQPAGHASAARRMIAAPTDGTVVALDPDIPPIAQRLKIRSASAPGTSIHWRLDGKPLGDQAELDWPLWPGHHHLELLDARRRVIDQINFEVRGATLRRQA
jgi:penicillin-binding protein 1C